MDGDIGGKVPCSSLVVDSVLLIGMVDEKFEHRYSKGCVMGLLTSGAKHVPTVLGLADGEFCDGVWQGYANYCLRLSPTDKADVCTGNPLPGIKGCERIEAALPFLAQFFQLGPLVDSLADLFPGGVSRKSDGVGLDVKEAFKTYVEDGAQMTASSASARATATDAERILVQIL
ncbi:hypothetical protein RHSIM_Rhsim05G0137200 [Rhododendron simsii]|uniref:Uncharacterized protein n=1 Tax=Rhododendron simsii TaxID=118357 RepID=A0A834LKF6_RHOSS|nr:hypothetical protein RHSIM_Rhsim05G0137200 [Rhododendron simsii]